jgi:hypothetical protein
MAQAVYDDFEPYIEQTAKTGNFACETDSESFEYPQSGAVTVTEKRLKDMLEEYKTVSSAQQICSLQDMRARLAHNYHMQGRRKESKELYSGILDVLRLTQREESRDGGLSDRMQELALECHRKRCAIDLDVSLETSLQMCYAMDHFCATTFGYQSKRRVEPLLMIEDTLRRLKKARDAEAAAVRWQEIWDKTFDMEVPKDTY